MQAVGLDFGTSNSAIAVTGEDRRVSLARFRHGDVVSGTMRSVLYFHPDERGARGALQPRVGVDAIDRYLANDGTGRLLQSIKSHVASRGFSATTIFEKTFSIEDLLAFFLRGLRAESEATLGPVGSRVVVGRPVKFAGEREGDGADLALDRLRAALKMAGFDDVGFEYEPVAAAYHYEGRLDHDELVMIADFGGGTSDFSLTRVGPGRRKLARPELAILGTEGVAVAGNALDAQIVRQVVAPQLGMSTNYRSLYDKTKVMPVPVWLFVHLRNWHHLSFLKSKKTMELLREIRLTAEDPAKIDALIHLIDNDLGFSLLRAVEALKLRLSKDTRGVLSFHDGPIAIEQVVTRDDFESWIADEVTEIDGCVDRLLARAGVSARDVDRVFMTGGTSLVPAVHEVIAQRFGEERIAGGEELTSVAQGLALRALEG